MILAIISDIHSNLEALNRIIETLDADMIMCFGDIVRYYTWPNECIKDIIKLETISVIGNHDLACLTGNTTGFNIYAKESIKWTRKIIEKENPQFLNNLKRKIKLKIGNINIMLPHGSPRDPISEYI